MNSPVFIIVLFSIIFVSSSGFAPSNLSSITCQRTSTKTSIPTTTARMVFGEDGERKSLSRENEPDEYFSSNLDKMSDKEKIPLALAGLAFISLPFIAGLIALYSAK
mmetsp:Transcript_16823/g.31865  ORF Transcript_16823/g.31865 Transcript_16823/m.31865 type:complete len:107 (+) Transcript_16823:88-408(+)|eukprot:CAMPEP_0176498518 /NCGR_PEP_ID=MMETSP0200_2-20121128/12368_1 /TAXON_ID=947934 /ORGANISM="Chaetoceros sp., Strain GSL56" /LENGTH=106 /DNA_ID=CAMNT_0017896739 /DNA_START=65 /DNA_END=385 /DNA_ORIENTATION=+